MFKNVLFPISSILFLLSPLVPAQDIKSSPGDDMIYKYLCAEADKLSAKFADGARTWPEWQQKRPRLHQEYLDMLGLWPLPEKTPLKATLTGTLQVHGVVVEKIHFQSKPGLYVTGNLYRPKEPRNAQRLPAILYVCGHADKGRDGNKSAYQDHGFWFANNGYVCLMLDSLQLGEIPGVHHGTYGVCDGEGSWASPPRKRGEAPFPTRFWWHSAGYTPAGVECWNGIRAIDYLQTRPDVDPAKIDETFVPRAKVTLPEKGKFEEWKKEMIARLRDKSFRPFTNGIPAAKKTGWPAPPVDELTVENSRIVHLVVTDKSEKRIDNFGAVVIKNQFALADTEVEWINDLFKGQLAFAVYSRGAYIEPWTKKSPPNNIERSHALLGRTVDQTMVWDTLASLKFASNELQQNELKIVGYGEAGIVAAYAALFEPSIKEIVVIDPPKSHMEGPHFLGVLRVLDIPEALGLLAPRPLTIIGGNDPAFDRTAEIYRLAGAADKLTRK